ncbi:ankyrin repeat protein [Colletotrichum asianum]|uniref:Ankyrin repeat protein n=1 Tax=Colletotrichum asianum TaxID=702518 RepID=A0A8H3ZYI0_9PEZI|nr:ankyrin repeat protein [Colletotrichum asianum]
MQEGQSTYNIEARGSSNSINGNVFGDVNIFPTDPGSPLGHTGPKTFPWLSSLDFAAFHKKVREEADLEKRGDRESYNGTHTGQWLLESGTFDRWKSKEIRQLWYYGMAGAGKTTLVSIIIDKMRHLRSHHREQHSVEQLLGSILKQMIGVDEVGKLAPEISHALRADGTGTMATVTPKDIADLIHGMSGKEHTYIVIDAIDEADEATRGALIEHLTPRKQQGNGISLLVTSRRCKDFDYLTEHFHKEEVFADETDIHLLVDHLFATKKSLGRLARTNSGLQPQVREAVTKASNRMFLAAKLQIAHLTPISDQRTLSEPPLNEEVLKLRHKLLEIGDPKKDMEEDARWAYWVLAWICLSPQSLGLSELREALARHPEQPMHLTRKDLDAQEMIKDICEGLVTFSEGKFSLVHYTTRVYFEERSATYFDKGHRTMESYASLDRWISSDPLMRHAAKWLGYHLRNSGSGLRDETIAKTVSLITDGPKMDFFYRLLDHMALIKPKLRRFPWDAGSQCQNFMIPSGRANPTRRSLILTTSRKCDDCEEILSPQYLDIVLRYTMYLLDIQEKFDTFGKDSDHLGDQDFMYPEKTFQLRDLKEGSVPVLHKILENNQDLNSLDAYNRTPVVVALQEGNIDIMDTCLKRGAQVNLADTEGRRLLLQVAQREDGSRKVVQSIIRQNRPYLNVEVGLGSMRNIPLLMGCIAIAGLSPLGYFSPPVERAYRRVFQGGGLMDLYQKQRSDNILDAADCGDVEAIERLVRDQRMSILERDPQVTMLTAFVAVESNQTNFLLALLDAGVNINVRDFEGNTLLHRATTRGNSTLVKGLLERNIDVKARNDVGLTAWAIGLKPGNQEVIDLLANHGARDPEARTADGLPVLYRPAAGGHLSDVQFLIRNGTNPSARTDYDWAPLHWAANNGHVECVRALVRAGAEHSPISDTFVTPLDLAIRQGHREIVSLLKFQGALRGDSPRIGSISYFPTLSGSSDDLDGRFASGSRAKKPAKYNNHKELNDNVIRDQRKFEAALLRLGKMHFVTALAKKKVFSFFFRDIKDVVQEYGGYGEGQVTIYEDVSRRWDSRIEKLKQRSEVIEIVSYKEDEEVPDRV